MRRMNLIIVLVAAYCPSQILTNLKNCTQCICPDGYFNHRGLGSCQKCKNCVPPSVVKKKCAHYSNTQCALCETGYFYTQNDGCQKCKRCGKYGIAKACKMLRNTICANNMSQLPPTMISQQNVYGKELEVVTEGKQVSSGSHSEKIFLQHPVWFYLFVIVLLAIIAIIFLMCCSTNRACGKHLYTMFDTTSLAGIPSLSSLMLNTNSKYPYNMMTEDEQKTLLCVLPGDYADALGLLLNPNQPNNWVQLAYKFNYTLDQAHHLKGIQDSTQELLFELQSKNTTVEILWQALKAIKRDDACSALVKFIVDRRNDDESVMLFEDI